MRIDTDRRFQAHLPDTSARGARTTDAAWGRRTTEWLDRGNTLSVGGRSLDAAGFRDVMARPDQPGREARLRELLHQPTLDYRDFTRLADDTIRADPAARDRSFGISETDARRHGVIDTDAFDRRYGTRGPVELSVSDRVAPVSTDTHALMTRADAAHAPALERAFQEDSHVRDLVGGRRFNYLSPEAQDRALRSLAAHPGESSVTGARADALHGLVESTAFGELTPADQRRLLAVSERTDTGHFDELQTLLDRQRGGQSALLSPAMGGAHERMLDSLYTLGHGELNERVSEDGVPRHELLGGALEEIANPGLVNQGSAGSCGVTSIEYALANRQPAEYARLLAEMATTGAATSASGERLEVPHHATFDRPGVERSASERLFQNTLMNSAVVGARYDPITDTRPGSTISTGVTGEHEARLMGMIYDRPYSSFEHGFFTMHSGADGADVMERLREPRDTPTMVGMRWVTGHHELVFDHVDAGRVYLRNPWGDVPQEAYDARLPADFHVRHEDDRGLISVPEAEFRDRVDSIVIAD